MSKWVSDFDIVLLELELLAFKTRLMRYNKRESKKWLIEIYISISWCKIWSRDRFDFVSLFFMILTYKDDRLHYLKSIDQKIQYIDVIVVYIV